MVVAGSADVVVSGQWSRLLRCLRSLVQSLLQDGFDAVGGGGSHLHRPETSSIQAGFVMAAGKTEQAQAGTISLLGMGFALQLPAHYITGRRADGECPVQQPSRGPFTMPLMGLGHVLRERAAAATAVLA